MAASPKKTYPVPVRVAVYAVSVLAVAWFVRTVAVTRGPKMTDVPVNPSEMMCSAEPSLEGADPGPQVRIVAILGDDEASRAAGAAAQAAVLARSGYASLVTVDAAEASEQMALYSVSEAPALIFLDGAGVEKTRLVAGFDTDKAVAAIDSCVPEGCGGCGDEGSCGPDAEGTKAAAAEGCGEGETCAVDATAVKAAADEECKDGACALPPATE